MKRAIPPKHVKEYYLITSANKTIIGQKKLEFVQDKLISFTLVDQQATHLIFEYKLYEQVMQGSSLLHYYSGDMDELQSTLLFKTDLQGNLADLLQLNDMKLKWQTGFEKNLKKKYPKEFITPLLEETAKLLEDKPRLLESFKGYSAWRFFFQHWFREFNAAETELLNLQHYFGNTDLPLLLQRKVTDHAIETTGTLHEAAFDRNAFSRTLKDLTHKYNIDATLDLTQEEQYQFTPNGSLENAELYLSTGVGTWYNVTSAHQLKRLSKQEFQEQRIVLENLKKERALPF
ncbi:hypothetical protein [Chitinophaga sancti]|uniref:hypothetical protein n=1 Tax=Chitinophaga sancti TaxID=1004 RepID=UPI003F79BEBD